LLNCTGENNACYMATQQALSEKGAMVSVDEPKEGSWRILVRTREIVGQPVSYSIREASLTPAANPIQPHDEKHASGADWSVTLPAKQNNAQYVAFRIAGPPSKDDKKKGLRIALTALTAGAP